MIRRVVLAVICSSVVYLPTAWAGTFTLSAAPTPVLSGNAITVHWTASAGEDTSDDWVAMYTAGTSDGAFLTWQRPDGTLSGDLTFTAPGTTGTYEFRYFPDNGWTVAKTSNQVQVTGGGPGPGSGSFTLTASPSSVAPAGSITVHWTASAGESTSDDWVAMYTAGTPDAAYLTWQRPDGTLSGDLTFTAPDTTGSYEFRYFPDNGWTVAKTSNQVQVGTGGGGGTQTPTTFSTYLGGSGTDVAHDVYIDRQGFIYVAGGTSSPNFPTTTGAYDRALQGFDAYVAKFAPDGTLVCSTLIGGPNYDSAYAIEVDEVNPQQPIYLAGRAGPGYPTTAGTVQPGFAGDTSPNPQYGPQDGFVTKLSNDCTQVIWSTYFGTDSSEIVRDLAVDPAGNIALVTTGTSRPNAHVPATALQPAIRGATDGVVAKLDSSGSLLYATYLGGAGADGEAPAIRTDAAGNAYVLMGTRSANMPASASAFQKTLGGSSDLFLAKISADGSQLLYGTYVGGSGNEFTSLASSGDDAGGHGVSIDAAGEAYVTANTMSTDLFSGARRPVTPGVQMTYGGDGATGTGVGTNYPGDGFIAKLSADGGQLLGGTYLGGAAGDGIQGSMIDASGNVYVCGATFSSNFPTLNASQRTYGGGGDGLAAEFSPDLSTMLFSTYVGGLGIGLDQLRAVGLGVTGAPQAVGQTTSSDFPTTSGAYQKDFQGGEDGVVTTINSSPNKPPVVSAIASSVSDADAAAPGLQVREGKTVVYSSTITDPDGDPVTWAWFYTVDGGAEIASATGTKPPTAAQASFTYPTGSAGKTYVWILRADDGKGTIERTLTVTVIPPIPGVNTVPVVTVEPDKTVSMPATNVPIAASATDDGLPNPPGALTYAWTKVSGPGTATFASPNTASTSVTLSAIGSYVLRLTVSDSALSATKDITIRAVDTTTPNTAPLVSAGPDKTVSFGDPVNLNGSASDDGLPNPPGTLTYAWSKVSGPGTVTFVNASAKNTGAAFSAMGVYVLQFTANDSALSASDTLTVTVGTGTGGGPPTITFFQASSTTITRGGSATLSWASTDATVCEGFEGSDGWAGPRELSGAGFAVHPQETTTYVLECSNAIGPVQRSVVITVVIPGGTYTLTAEPPAASTVGQFVVSWTVSPADQVASTDAIGLYLPGAPDNPPLALQRNELAAAEGSVTFRAPSTPGTYEFRYLVDVAGVLQSRKAVTVTVNADGYAITSVSPNPVVAGQTITVGWSANPPRVNDWIAFYAFTNEDNHTPYLSIFKNVFTDPSLLTTSGTVTFTIPAEALAGTYQFRYFRNGEFLDVARSVPVEVVVVPPEVTLNANPTTILTDLGQSSALTWVTKYAVSCTASSDNPADPWQGPKPLNNTIGELVTPTVTTTYTLSCTNPAGTTPKSVTVTVVPPTPTLEIRDPNTGEWIPSPASEAKFLRGTGQQIWFRVTGASPRQQVRIRWTNGGPLVPGEPWTNIFTDPRTGAPYTTGDDGSVEMGPFPDANGVPDTSQLDCTVAGVTCWPIRPGYENEVQVGNPATGVWSDWSNKVLYAVEGYELTAGSSSVDTGAPITATWNVPSTAFMISDWIGLYRVGESVYIPSDWYRVPDGVRTGSHTFTAPAMPGIYEFRYLPRNDYTVVTYSRPVAVGLGGNGILLQLGKSSSGPWTNTDDFEHGQQIWMNIVSPVATTDVRFSWTDKNGNWTVNNVTLPAPGGGNFRTDALGGAVVGPFPDGGGIPISWPDGAYSIKVSLGSFTSNVVTVGLGSYSVTATPAAVTTGAPITVTWNTPVTQQMGWDWLGLYQVGMSNYFPEASYIIPDGMRTGSHVFTAPNAAGTYEVRYLPRNDYVDAARSAPVTVSVPAGSLPTCAITSSTGSSALVGELFDVPWTNSAGVTSVMSSGWSGPINPRPLAGGLPGCTSQSPTCTWGGLQFTSPGTASVTITVTNAAGLSNTCSISITGSAAPAPSVRVNTSGTGTFFSSVSVKRGVGQRLFFSVAGGKPNTPITFYWTTPGGSNFSANFGTTNNDGTAVVLGPFPDAGGVPIDWPLGAYSVKVGVNGVNSSLISFTVTN